MTHALRGAACLLAVMFALVAGSEAAGQAERGGVLEARLDGLVAQAERGELPAEAELDGIEVEDGRVRVIIEARGESAGHIPERARALGASIEGTHGTLVQVQVPIGQLRPLAASPGVAQVRLPLRAYPVVTSQGVAQSNADDWQAAGLTGDGVKVAILDLGFQGYESKLGTELPASVTAMSFVAGGDIYGGGQPHGTAVAEVVHDMAPDAELFLANFSTEVELANAVAWLESQGVQIVNASWGYVTSGPGDGSGIVNDIVTASVNSGVFWSVAAGNFATSHWAGQFVDTDQDNFHEFSQSPIVEANQLNGSFFGWLLAGEEAIGEMRWNDPFNAACRDYDLYLVRSNDEGVTVPVAASENVQYDGTDCVPGANPIETIQTTVPVTDFYHWVIAESHAPTPATIDLFSITHELAYQTAAGSLGQPADNFNVTTVGAVPYYAETTIEPFSSQGPNAIGLIKPEIVAHDAVSNSTYGNFFGTSAAAPHVAGAAALFLETNPCLTPIELRSALETNVVDLGTPGKDSTFGSGRLLLGATPSNADADILGDFCDNCPTVPNNDQANQDGDPYGDACEQPNCVTVPNYWTVAPGDSDCDGYADTTVFTPRASEQTIGTLQTQRCASIPGANNEPLPDAWPPDFNDNRLVNGADVLHYNNAINHPITDPPVVILGQEIPLTRFDLNGNGLVNGADVLQLNAFFSKTCT